MTSKERMMTALTGGIPDRLPATIHQWQDYHLKTYMKGASDIEAFRAVELDAAITRYPFIYPDSPDWRVEKSPAEEGRMRYRIRTPEGELSYETQSNEYTTWMSEHMIKRDEDIELLRRYYPPVGLDKRALRDTYDEIGDAGILRMFIIGFQGGCWQDACELYGTENLIMATYDKPEWVKRFLDILLEQKLRFISDNMAGVRVDLVETGGGAASSTVISPAIHETFCLPYDTAIHQALHDLSLPVVYHTCGGMKAILPLIIENGCDVSETLSPTAVGGDIERKDRDAVKERLGKAVCLVGGMDQITILGGDSLPAIRDEVHNLFETFGRDGGYVMSASDHFFHAAVENLKEYSRAARECVY